MNCAEASQVLASSVSTVEARREAQQHVLTCGECGEVVDHTSLIENLRARMGGHLVVRGLLAAIALVQLSLAIPWLLGSDGWWGHAHEAADLHVTRDGAIAIVVVTAALTAAWSRRFAWFCLLPISLATAFQIIGGIYDDSQHRISSGFELIHLIDVIVLVLIVIEVRPTRSR
jgi:hypothetical protein